MNTNNENDTLKVEAEEVVVDADEFENETDPEALKEIIRKRDDANKQLYARTKKAEGFELKDGKWVKPTTVTPEKKPEATASISKDKLSTTDFYAVVKADIPEDDLGEVIEFANLKNISVAEALKHPVVKAILSTNAETRKVAEGTNTSGARRGNAKLSDEALLSNAESGKLPESDDDIVRLIKLQRELRKK